ncbi:HEAT repeat family protein [Histomonas meleagridis]|uniref:HEAT repeat family protein n=1 Tax=Histomonas meleagridis TaxID=135588 RepID=UPI00355A250A|nr:HEAT repeat family protein [Histomonas meleagridis]KAH0801858.1 HEAT repeat family protein [Histomonas meleagridis]
MEYIQKLLLNENDLVSDSMLDMLPDFVDEIFKYFPKEADIILSLKILPLVHLSIGKESKHFAESYAVLIFKMSHSSFVDFEVPFLLQLSHDPNPFYRSTIATVIGFLVEYINPTSWWNALLELFSNLSSDTHNEIRADVPPLVALYCQKSTSPREKSQLSGKFSLFCRDPSSRVRCSAAENIVSLTEGLDSASKLFIVPIVNLLMSDPSDTVRKTLSQNLGPLLSTIGDKAKPSLVIKYCTALNSPDVNISYSAAFSFAAVALSLGVSRFQELKESFERAINSSEYRIRRTLSYSFFKFANFFSPSEALEIAIGFLMDIPSVAIGIMSSLGDMIDYFDKKESLFEFMEHPALYEDWRMRLEISKQLRKCKKYFQKEKLINVAFQLLKDPVWKVRKDASLSYAMLMSKDDFPKLLELVNDKNYFEREIAADIIAQSCNEYWNDFMKLLEKLCDDIVPNVRTAAARAVAEFTKKVDNNEELNQLVNKLKSDEDEDVRKAMLN